MYEQYIDYLEEKEPFLLTTIKILSSFVQVPLTSPSLKTPICTHYHLLGKLFPIKLVRVVHVVVFYDYKSYQEPPAVPQDQLQQEPMVQLLQARLCGHQRSQSSTRKLRRRKTGTLAPLSHNNLSLILSRTP